MSSTPLFGGALSLPLPPSFHDVSALREVPDHQEVFAEGGAQGASLILEVVEAQADLADAVAAHFFWADLASCNGAREGAWRALHPPPAPLPLGGDPRCAAVVAGVGAQLPDGGGAPVCVALAALRLPSMGSELLLSVNVPSGGGGGAGAAEARAEALLLAALPELRVHDWGLFCAGEGGGALEE